MDILVDAFYYDYILSMALEYYSRGDRGLEFASYCVIANRLSAIFIDKGLVLDSETYAKSIAIRFILLCAKEEKDLVEELPMLFDYLVYLDTLEGTVSSDQMKALITYLAICYLQYTDAGIVAKEQHLSFIEKHLCTTNIEKLKLAVNMRGKCTTASLSDGCQAIHYNLPIMRTFVQTIKQNIDESTNVNQSAKGKVDILTNSPGQKVVWD